MKARTRNILTLVSLGYVGMVGALVGRVPLSTLNVLLVTVAVPMVWLIWAFCRWSAYQHASRWARDIEKVHGPQRQTAGAVR